MRKGSPRNANADAAGAAFYYRECCREFSRHASNLETTVDQHILDREREHWLVLDNEDALMLVSKDGGMRTHP
jgi:hypothetical protein